MLSRKSPWVDVALTICSELYFASMLESHINKCKFKHISQQVKWVLLVLRVFQGHLVPKASVEMLVILDLKVSMRFV